MANRRKMANSVSKSVFIKAAVKTHVKNLPQILMRGGYRA